MANLSSIPDRSCDDIDQRTLCLIVVVLSYEGAHDDITYNLIDPLVLIHSETPGCATKSKHCHLIQLFMHLLIHRNVLTRLRIS